MALPWTPEYSVGVALIDEQHKHFLGILNKLYADIQKSISELKIDEVLKELSEYTEVHFATEEKYFKEFKYEEAEEHIGKHNEFRAKIENFLFKAEKGEEEITTELVDYMENWLVNHIADMDRKYTKCFNDHGLK